MSKAWIYVILGGMLEVIWAISLKLSNGFTETLYSVITVVFVIISFYLFSKGMSLLPSGVAYTVFTGIGAVGTIIVSILFLNESVTFSKIFFSIVLIAAIINLKMATGEES